MRNARNEALSSPVSDLRRFPTLRIMAGLTFKKRAVGVLLSVMKWRLSILTRQSGGILIDSLKTLCFSFLRMKPIL